MARRLPRHDKGGVEAVRMIEEHALQVGLEQKAKNLRNPVRKCLRESVIGGMSRDILNLAGRGLG